MTEQPFDLTTHAQEVQELWQAYARGENKRVPLTFACDEQMWLKISNNTFREFYTIPEVHLKAQLEGKRWFCENVIGDTAPGLPEQWAVGVQFWMDENEFFGCEVDYQENDYAWARPLAMDLENLIGHVRDIDAEERVRKSTAFTLYFALKELCQERTFFDRPISVGAPGLSTHGIFTKAAEIRGPEQICIDIYERPEQVAGLLAAVTEKTIERIRAAHRLAAGQDLALPDGAGFGFCDDSLQMISPDVYERLVLPHHEKLCSTMTTGPRSIHLCGRATQHYEALRWKLGITSIDGPGPFVDHGYYLRTLGPEMSFNAQLHHTVLERGSEAEIEQMVRSVLTPEAKIPGRFNLLGYVTRNTPMESVRACYDCVRKYGVIGQSG